MTGRVTAPDLADLITLTKQRRPEAIAAENGDVFVYRTDSRLYFTDTVYCRR